MKNEGKNKLTMRKTIIILFVLTLFIQAVANDKQMTMTTSSRNVSIKLGGSGTTVINWGDGKPDEKITLSGSWTTHRRTYATSSSRTITITGNDVRDLICNGNQLTALDVSRNTALEDLYCYNNRLTTLDVSQNTELWRLHCYENQLTSLDVSQNTNLTDLSCEENRLTTLDVSQNRKLIYLHCPRNQLTALDLSANTVLKGLGCQENQLTALDLSVNTVLKSLSGSNNRIVSLDLSSCVELEEFWFYDNQLTELDLSQNTVLQKVDIQNNQLDAKALNSLLATLHGNDVIFEKIVRISGNPGTEQSLQRIARNNGWVVEPAVYEAMDTTTSEKEEAAEFDVWDFYNSGVSEDFYNRLNSKQALPDDSQTLKQLQQGISDTLVIRKTFSDKNGNNKLEIKVINPCRLAENFESGSEDFWKYYRVDGIINYIEVCRTNKNDSDTLIYYNPDVAMSLINLLENNIALKSVSGKQAVFIPFAYCGNANDDRQITCIVFYDHRKYIYHINLHGEEFQNYKIVDNLDEKFKDLPKKLETELIKYINSQYKEVILEFEEQINTNSQ